MQCPVCKGKEGIKKTVPGWPDGFVLLDCQHCDGHGKPGENQWWIGRIGKATGIVAQLVFDKWVVRGEYTTVTIRGFEPVARMKKVEYPGFGNG